MSTTHLLLSLIASLFAVIGYFLNRLILSIDSLKSAVDALTIANAVKDVDLNDIKVRLSDIEMVVDSHAKVITDIHINCKMNYHDK